MENLIENLSHTMRLAQDKAEAHLQFARMFTLSDMSNAAKYHYDKASEKRAEYCDAESLYLFLTIKESF